MKAYELVLRDIERQILEGSLTVGSALASEREMATRYGVSRTAVREAIRTLAAQGLVTSNVGAGPESGTRVTDRPGPALGKLLQMHVALEQFSRDDIVDARIMLECFNVRLASEKAQEDDLRKISALLTRMEAPYMGLTPFNTLDTAFHVAISELTGNQFMTLLTTAIRQALSGPIEKASRAMPDWQKFRLDLIAQHRRIFDAVSQRDTARAERLMEDHIRTAYNILPMD